MVVSSDTVIMRSDFCSIRRAAAAHRRERVISDFARFDRAAFARRTGTPSGLRGFFSVKASLDTIHFPCFAPVRLRRKRSEEHTSELQSLMRISYAVFCLKKKT